MAGDDNGQSRGIPNGDDARALLLSLQELYLVVVCHLVGGVARQRNWHFTGALDQSHCVTGMGDDNIGVLDARQYLAIGEIGLVGVGWYQARCARLGKKLMGRREGRNRVEQAVKGPWVHAHRNKNLHRL
jgi:hypothetical protein